MNYEHHPLALSSRTSPDGGKEREAVPGRDEGRLFWAEPYFAASAVAGPSDAWN